jgi:tetrahydromethanopterin S-methyltransferase subunit B
VSASFPGSLRPFSFRVDLRDTVIANDVNALQEEVYAVETTIGTASNSNKPLESTYAGSFALTTTWSTISDRLANIEAGLIGGVGTSSIYATKASPTFTGTVTVPSLVLTNALSVPYGGTGLQATTKGGIFVGTNTTTLVNLTVGSNNQLLTADSGQPSGVKWADAPISLPPQSTHANQYLTTDGSNASWTPLPDQYTSGFLLGGM